MDAQQPEALSPHWPVTSASAALHAALSGAAGTNDVGDNIHCPAAVRSCSRRVSAATPSAKHTRGTP